MAWLALQNPLAAAASNPAPVSSRATAISSTHLSSHQTVEDERSHNVNTDFDSVVFDGAPLNKGYTIVNPTKFFNSQADRKTQRQKAGSKWTPDIGLAQEVLQTIRKNAAAAAGNENISSALGDWDKPLSSRAIVAVLSSFSNDWNLGLQFFNWSKSRSHDLCDVTIFSYNMMLKLLRDGQQWEISQELLREMLQRRITPDNYTFSLFVSCSKQCDRAEEAIGWFHRLVESGVAFDEVTYSSMIDLFGKAGRTAEAMDLYQNLKKNNNWKPDLVTFGVMANVYSRVGDYQSIMRIFRDMEESNVRPNVVLFNTLIGTLGRAGKINLARGMFEEMVRSYGLIPSEVTLSIYIDMFTKVGALDKAAEVYEMIKLRGWKCDSMVYNTLLKSCVESGNVARAEGLMEEMRRRGCFPDHMSYGIMMNVYATRGLVSELGRMFSELSKLTAFPRASYYTMLIKACKQAQDFDRIPEIFHEMVTSGCSVNERMSGMLMSCATSTHIGEQARLGILGCIAQVNPRLHELMSRLMRRDQELEEIGKEMHAFLIEEVSAESRKPMCNALIDFCWALGMKVAGRKLLEAGISGGFYHGLHTNLPSLWQLNLRTLSFCAADCALEAWMEKLVAAVEQGEELPQDLMVETGTGRAKEAINSVSLSDVVGSRLRSLNSPFDENQRPTGYFIATGPAVKLWLEATRRR